MTDVSGNFIFNCLVGECNEILPPFREDGVVYYDGSDFRVGYQGGLAPADGYYLAYDGPLSAPEWRPLALGAGELSPPAGTEDGQYLVYSTGDGEYVSEWPDKTFLQVSNNTGSPISKGDALHITGAKNNNVAYVELADASDSTKMPAIGIAREDIAAGADGIAITFGRAGGLDTSLVTVGNTVYVSPTTPGGITQTKPTGATELIQNIGVCMNSDANNGVIKVTGIGRANDIPNAEVVTDASSVDYVYVDSGNRFKKITRDNLIADVLGDIEYILSSI